MIDKKSIPCASCIISFTALLHLSSNLKSPQALPRCRREKTSATLFWEHPQLPAQFNTTDFCTSLFFRLPLQSRCFYSQNRILSYSAGHLTCTSDFSIILEFSIHFSLQTFLSDSAMHKVITVSGIYRLFIYSVTFSSSKAGFSFHE